MGLVWFGLGVRCGGLELGGWVTVADRGWE